jgi:hypothetical protein
VLTLPTPIQNISEKYKLTLEQMKNIRKVNEAHMKHRRDVDLINEYANLNRHVAYGTAAYAVFIGNNIDAFV